MPAYAPDFIVVEYDTGYYPSGVSCAYLRIRWYEIGDFSVHYSEQYRDSADQDFRWGRHPNPHNSRDHFHPPPDAVPGEDRDYSDDWRDVLTTVFRGLDRRIEAFWD